LAHRVISLVRNSSVALGATDSGIVGRVCSFAAAQAPRAEDGGTMSDRIRPLKSGTREKNLDDQEPGTVKANQQVERPAGLAPFLFALPANNMI